MVEIDRFMAAARRRWWVTHLARWACQGVVAGGTAGAAALLGGGGRWLALGLTVAGAWLVPLARWRRVPTPVALAALLDREAGLGSALTAAVEFRQRDDPWCAAQRRHVATLLPGLAPATLLPWRAGGWLAAAAAALLAVTFLPQGRTLDTPSPREGGGGRAVERAALAGKLPDGASTPTAPTPPLPRGGRETAAHPPQPANIPSLREGAGGRANGPGGAPGTPPEQVASPTSPTPALPPGGRGTGGGQGDTAGTAATGDLGTAPAATPLLGRTERILPNPGGPSTLALAAGNPPGPVAAPAGPAGSPPPATTPGTTPILVPAPPEAVPMHLRPIVARYFDLLHPPREGDEP